MFKKTNRNILFLGGALSCSLFFIFFYFFSDEFLNLPFPSSRVSSGISFYLYFLLAVFLAPLAEEFAFRGYFLRKKIIKILSLVFLLILVLFTGKTSVLHLCLLFLFFATGIILLKRKSKNEGFKNMAMLLNALLFAFLHYEPSDFRSVFTISPALFQFGIGLILIWIVINWNLLRAIVFHTMINLVFVSLMAIPLLFPNDIRHRVESEKIVMEWEKVSLINDTNMKIKLEKNNDTIKGTDTTLKAFLGLISLSSSGNYKKNVQKAPFAHYNIQVYVKKPYQNTLDENIYSEIRKLMVKEGLIYPEN